GADQAAHGPVADAVVHRLELLVDQERQEVAAPHLAVDDLAHGVEGRVRQTRELDQIEQQQVQVLERLAQQRQRRLRHRVAHQLLDVRIEPLVRAQVGLDVAVEAREVHLLLAQDRRAQLDHPQQRVVDEPQLLGPVARGHRPRLALGQGLGADSEEALEAPEPHLELEELRGLAGHRDLVGEAPELVAEQLGADFGRSAPRVVSAVPRHPTDYSLPALTPTRRASTIKSWLSDGVSGIWASKTPSSGSPGWPCASSCWLSPASWCWS